MSTEVQWFFNKDINFIDWYISMLMTHIETAAGVHAYAQNTVFHSSKCPGHVTKSLRVGAYFFNIFGKDQPKKLHKYSSRPSYLMERGMVDYSMAYNLSKWALIGAWAAIGTNTVLDK